MWKCRWAPTARWVPCTSCRLCSRPRLGKLIASLREGFRRPESLLERSFLLRAPARRCRRPRATAAAAAVPAAVKPTQVQVLTSVPTSLVLRRFLGSLRRRTAFSRRYWPCSLLRLFRRPQTASPSPPPTPNPSP